MCEPNIRLVWFPYMLPVDEPHIFYSFILFYFLNKQRLIKTVISVVLKSSNHLCIGNVLLIIQCHLAAAGLFGINKQGALQNYLRQDVITNRIFRQIKREACSEFLLTRLQKSHYASPTFPLTLNRFLFQTFVLID